MAVVQAFRALRYDLGQVGVLSDVVAPPYDVIDAAQQETLYRRHPANVVRLILNRAEPGDKSPTEKYARAARFSASMATGRNPATRPAAGALLLPTGL